MTRQELKSLPHLALVEENKTTLHIHLEDGYKLYRYEKEEYEIEGEKKVHCSIMGSHCFYFQIYEEYPKYELVTAEEYEKLEAEFEAASEEGKLVIVEKFLG
jgi:hypothetical protein